MKKSITLILLALLGLSLSGQVAPDKYYVQFTDKDNSPYSISNPEEYLSQKAIDRRNQQNISIDLKDLPVNPSYLSGVAATGAQILNPTKWFNGVTIFTEDPGVLDAINALPYVQSVRAVVNPNIPQEEKTFFAREDYDMVSVSNRVEKNVSAIDYGEGYNQIEMLNGHLLHEMGFQGQGMVIAVLDAGFLSADVHPAFDSLWANGQILGTRDFVDGGEVTYATHYHGTMVLSCMASNYPGELVGTAPKADYWLLRSEDGDSEYIIEEYNWVSAAEFADSAGADIINSSLGYTVFNDPQQDHTYDDMDGNTTPITIGADIAASRGMLVVNSAGNEGNSFWYYLSAPSDGDSVVGVGAVDADGIYASFSSHGPSSDGRVKPNVVAQGSGTWVAEPWSMMFTYGGGTSFSSPVTAGMMACLWQANPDMKNMQLLDAVQQSASQYYNPDDELGYGIPDYALANNILTLIGQHGEANGPDWGFSAYPNPFSGRLLLTVETADTLQGIVEIFDIIGQKIAEYEINSLSSLRLDLGELPDGIYMARVTLDNQSRIEKLIKR